MTSFENRENVTASQVVDVKTAEKNATKETNTTLQTMQT